MRIAYVCYLRAFAPDGVNDKIARATESWRRAGHDVELLALSQAPPPGAEPVVPARVFAYPSMRRRVRATLALARAVRRLAPDVVYLRYDRYVPPLGPLLWPRTVVVEVNTDDTKETRLWSRQSFLYNELNRRVTLPLAAGLVSVTHELAAAPAFTRFRKPTLVIANSADARRAAPLPAPADGGRRSAVMLVGAMAPWMGVDKAVELARAMPDLDLHLVGCGREDVDGDAPPNLRLHGRLSPAQFRPLLAAADFGIGPLCCHRKQMEEASPLKVRDYLLHGLPVLIAHTDTDFPGELPWYLLRIPNAEDGVARSLAAIRAWAERVRGRRVDAEEVVARVGSDAKERARLAFLAALAGAS